MPSRNPRFTETNLKKQLITALSTFPNIYYRKLSDRFHAGLPDFIIVYNGKTVWLELKVYPNKLTALQGHEITKLRNSGANVYCLTYFPQCYRLSNGQEYKELTQLLKEVLQ
jgi:hypothetical protein